MHCLTFQTGFADAGFQKNRNWISQFFSGSPGAEPRPVILRAGPAAPGPPPGPWLAPAGARCCTKLPGTGAHAPPAPAPAARSAHDARMSALRPGFDLVASELGPAGTDAHLVRHLRLPVGAVPSRPLAQPATLYENFLIGGDGLHLRAKIASAAPSGRGRPSQPLAPVTALSGSCLPLLRR